MSRPIKELPTLTGEAAANFLKRADAAERRYKERKEAGRKKMKLHNAMQQEHKLHLL